MRSRAKARASSSVSIGMALDGVRMNDRTILTPSSETVWMRRSASAGGACEPNRSRRIKAALCSRARSTTGPPFTVRDGRIASGSVRSRRRSSGWLRRYCSANATRSTIRSSGLAMGPPTLARSPRKVRSSRSTTASMRFSFLGNLR